MAHACLMMSRGGTTLPAVLILDLTVSQRNSHIASFIASSIANSIAGRSFLLLGGGTLLGRVIFLETFLDLSMLQVEFGWVTCLVTD